MVDKDLRPDEGRLLEVIRESAGPLSARQTAAKALGTKGDKTVSEVEKLLDSLAASGGIHRFPPSRKGGATRYGKISPVDWVATKIRAAVDAKDGKSTIKGVKERLAKWEIRFFDEALGRLIREGRLHYLHVRHKYLVSFKPRPFDHLLDWQKTALKEIVDRINRTRAVPLTMEALESFLNGTPPEDGRSVDRPAGRPTVELLRRWYDEDEPRLGGVTSMPIPWTWERYRSWCREQGLRPDLESFQELFRRLKRDGRIELIPHGRTERVSEKEARIAIPGPAGEMLYFWRWR